MLFEILYRKYDCKKVMILLDEYDAPLENAYLKGYWDAAAEFFGQFYKKSFKENEFLGRVLITGINVIPKHNLNSLFNNSEPCIVLSPLYDDSFGITQEEVDNAFCVNLACLTKEKK